MSTWLQHAPVLPIIIPFLAAALTFIVRDQHRGYKLGLGALSLLLQCAAAWTLLRLSDGSWAASWEGGVGVYALGQRAAPLGIVLVVDRLAAMMLLLTSVLAMASWCYATARWDRRGVRFYPLFQLLLMGLNGAFLTGDLFNLFVFFEVFLAASYGLLLHGLGRERVAASLHYIAVNLLSALLLLIAIAMAYGLTGTLNLADLALRAGQLDAADRRLFEVAMGILSVAFLIKAAAWPLNFWLIDAYAEAAPPVAAMFAMLTKVGIYALLRIGSLLLPSGAPAAFGGDWMFPVGMATLLFGSMGMLLAQQPQRLAGFATITSSGTLLSALGMPGVMLTGPALYYLISSVLALAAFYLLVEMLARTQAFGADVLALSEDVFDLADAANADGSDDVVGQPIPRAMVFLGLAFIACALLLVGLPPLSGFVAKLGLLSAALYAAGDTSNAWLLTAAVLVSGFLGLLAWSRMGILLFWGDGVQVPRLRWLEALPVAFLIGLCIWLTMAAGPVSTYLNAAAAGLDDPSVYIRAVLGTAAVAGE